jgi:GAF domain-containing protein
MQPDLAQLQDALLGTDSVEQFLAKLAVLATTMTAGGLSCGMLARRGRTATVTASSDPLASAAGEVQDRTGEGPGLDALRHARAVLIEDTLRAAAGPGTAGADDCGDPDDRGRCRRFRETAARAGVRSCYAVPLIVDGQAAGALALYSRQPSAFGPDLIARTAAFARHASGALALALRLAAYAELNQQLKSSMASRAVIDQAVGVIMATEHCSQDRAFALLRGVSQNTNIKLRALAADIVTNVSGEPPQPAASFHHDD